MSKWKAGTVGFVCGALFFSGLTYAATDAAGIGWDDVTSSIYVGDKPVQNPAPESAALQVFPKDNPWNTDISSYPVHQKSAQFISSIGLNTSLHTDFGTMWEGAPIGIPYTVVGGDQPKVM